MVIRGALLARPAIEPQRWGERVAMFGVLLLLALSLLVVTVDDRRTHGALPQDSAAAHTYMAAMVQNNPAAMWTSYSTSARQARGGDQAAFVAYMRLGTHPRSGPANPFTLVATVPLDAGRTLLFYQVALTTDTGPSHLLVPMVTDAAGAVDEAGDDGIFFVPPHSS